MRGWLINDKLTCIPGTRTFWHDLLDWIPGLEYANPNDVDFNFLAQEIETRSRRTKAPDYIIRNGTFFRPLNTLSPRTKTISLIQDIYSHEDPRSLGQIDVGSTSDVVVYNSEYTKSAYEKEIHTKSVVIPLGVDFEHFTPSDVKHPEVLQNSILFVGAATNYPKGFDRVINLIHTTEYNFCLVMKDGYTLNHPRVKVFNQVNHDELKKIYNSCAIILCTSHHETQHLASIEAAACDIPVITTNVGAYYNRLDGSWGKRVDLSLGTQSLIDAINLTLADIDSYRPREFALNAGLDKLSCMRSWQELIKDLNNENRS